MPTLSAEQIRKFGMDRHSLDSAMVYMKKGIEKELCYQRR
jgi:hypothetical protein